jgi:hypothetical protein
MFAPSNSPDAVTDINLYSFINGIETVCVGGLSFEEYNNTP